MKAWNFKDLTGQRFGMVQVVSFAGKNKHRNSMWNCVCDCGSELVKSGGGLASSISCGCLRIPAAVKAKTTHGMCRSITYKTWESMRRRCLTPGWNGYKEYGARGICICAEWDDFSVFLNDMGERPSLSHSIERINNEGNYSKDNCRWATKSEQARNRRTSRLLTINVETKTMAEWSEISGVKASTIQQRLVRGYSHEDAVFRPLDPRGSKCQ